MSKPKKKIIEYRNYFLPDNFPLVLLYGDYWKISDKPSGRLHFHNCLEIGVCHSDDGIMEIMGQSIPFQAGDVTVIPKNIPHTTYSSKGKESHWTYLFWDPHDLFRSLLPTTWFHSDLSYFPDNGFQYVLSHSAYPIVYSLLEHIIRELSQKRPNYQISAKGLLLAFYTELCRIEAAETTKAQTEASVSRDAAENSLVISPALDYIEANYMDPFSIEALSDLCHWSPTHFRRVFHDIMDMSPLDYVNNTRILKSCNLLRSTEGSILDISETVGFHSVSSYNRSFAKVMQMSPREYRKEMQQSEKKAENTSILKFAGWMFPE